MKYINIINKLNIIIILILVISIMSPNYSHATVGNIFSSADNFLEKRATNIKCYRWYSIRINIRFYVQSSTINWNSSNVYSWNNYRNSIYDIRSRRTGKSKRSISAIYSRMRCNIWSIYNMGYCCKYRARCHKSNFAI